MYVLLLCSIFVITIGVERIVYFARADSGRKFAGEFYHLCAKGRLVDAKNLAIKTKGDLAFLLNISLDRINRKDFDTKIFFEAHSNISLAKFRARLYYLNIIITMAPLLGLLGTISGMISAFSIFNTQENQSSAVTGGIGEALIATATGLCVAIIALTIHSYFIQRVDHIVTDMELSFSAIEIQLQRGNKNEAS
ncbi:MotA/TolQ/ExbB proton channel family protein [Pectinatus haikarae]|uniref:Biopolymer transport protein ExbB n=2 Tax=Pectinatus haikarae TaxID=349096 RepID=A0ABT9Y583_9FIRM|nr:MotA/TolQ/ExbB proton channel family protein [Pectinatus haikarae]MDQ0202990.1 biopolymer transport protein ExbB [Pectinatus haikarae]